MLNWSGGDERMKTGREGMQPNANHLTAQGCYCPEQHLGTIMTITQNTDQGRFKTGWSREYLDLKERK